VTIEERIARLEAIVGNGLSDDVKTLIGEMKATRDQIASFRGSFVMLKWMIGLLLVASTAIVGVLL